MASGKVHDEALFRAKNIIDEMLALRKDLRNTLISNGVRVVIMSQTEVTTDIPEWSDLYEAFPGTDWDTRARGLGATLDRPATGAGEENLLCYEGDIYRHEDILVHEFSHTVLNLGVEHLPGGRQFKNRLVEAYRNALDAGLWEGTYAAMNQEEYWAEGVQSWFGLNDPAGEIHNDINTRAELENYDPALAGLIEEVFGDVLVTSSCHETIDTEIFASIQGMVISPNDQPLKGVRLWAWQGSKETSGFGSTNKDGEFSIDVPGAGFFTLDIYVGEGCGFVGWYDGEGITSERSLALKLEVVEADISDITIKLPGQPDDLPEIEWCAP